MFYCIWLIYLVILSLNNLIILKHKVYNRYVHFSWAGWNSLKLGSSVIPYRNLFPSPTQSLITILKTILIRHKSTIDSSTANDPNPQESIASTANHIPIKNISTIYLLYYTHEYSTLFTYS